MISHEGTWSLRKGKVSIPSFLSELESRSQLTRAAVVQDA
jgi:hypothetical protein